MKEVLAEVSGYHNRMELKADTPQAAERRMRDDKACHPQDHGHAQEVEEEVRKAQQESVGIDAIELDSDSSAEVVTPPGGEPHIIDIRTPSPDTIPTAANGDISLSNAGPSRSPPRKLPIAKPVPLAKTSQKAVNRNDANRPEPKSKPTEPDQGARETTWSCPSCTYINKLNSPSCEICTTPRPRRKGDGSTWFCEFCGAGPREMEFWSCTDCGWVRNWG